MTRTVDGAALKPPLDEDGTPLEFTCRLGWPAFNIELALHKNNRIAFLVGLASDASAPKQRQLDVVAVCYRVERAA